MDKRPRIYSIYIFFFCLRKILFCHGFDYETSPITKKMDFPASHIRNGDSTLVNNLTDLVLVLCQECKGECAESLGSLSLRALSSSALDISRHVNWRGKGEDWLILFDIDLFHHKKSEYSLCNSQFSCIVFPFFFFFPCVENTNLFYLSLDKINSALCHPSLYL